MSYFGGTYFPPLWISSFPIIDLPLWNHSICVSDVDTAVEQLKIPDDPEFTVWCCGIMWAERYEWTFRIISNFSSPYGFDALQIYEKKSFFGRNQKLFLNLKFSPIVLHLVPLHFVWATKFAMEWFAVMMELNKMNRSLIIDTMYRLAVEHPECCMANEFCYLYLRSFPLLIFGSIVEPYYVKLLCVSTYKKWVCVAKRRDKNEKRGKSFCFE